MKTPSFMAGVVAKKVSPMAALAVKAPSIRNVTWGAAEATPEPVHEEAQQAPPEVEVEVAVEPVPEAAPEPVALSQTISPEAEGAIRQLNAAAAAFEQRTNDDAIELGVMLARKILEIEITTNLEAMKALVASAIRKAGESQITHVRLHPEDAARFEGDAAIGAEVVADPTLQRGDVMVDTAQHSIDGRIATRFEALLKQLDGAA